MQLECKLKASCKSPANIAFIKYWGKIDSKTRLPQNNSISMCLSNLYSICTVEFNPKYKNDQIIFLKEKTVKPKELKRISAVLDRVRNLAKTNLKAKVVTKNNFPRGIGISSSASGLSAVTFASLQALGLKLSTKELTILCRQASGSACRSIPDGFVEWKKGTKSSNSYAFSLYPAKFWDICDLVCVVNSKMKKVSSTESHALANTSIFQKIRLKNIDLKIKQLKKAIKEKNFSTFGKIIENEALELHSICFTSKPAIIYLEPKTITIMKDIIQWREKGMVESYFTLDAGPTVHVICLAKDEKRLMKRLKQIKGIEKIVSNKPANGAEIIAKHLF